MAQDTVFMLCCVLLTLACLCQHRLLILATGNVSASGTFPALVSCSYHIVSRTRPLDWKGSIVLVCHGVALLSPMLLLCWHLQSERPLA